MTLVAAKDGPTPREIELYYFTLDEVADMLWCDRDRLCAEMGQGRYGEVWHKQKCAWMIPPDQVQHLREALL